MPRLHVSLSSREGDRMGHLVRAVQMIYSYGKECDVLSCSDVWEDMVPGEPLCLAVVLEADSENSEQAVRQVCKEVEWSLGERGPQPGAPESPPGDRLLGGEDPAVGHPGILACELLNYGGRPVRPGIHGLPPAVLAALEHVHGWDGEERQSAGHPVRQVLPADKFLALCQQGQREGFGAVEVMGERPSGVSAPP